MLESLLDRLGELSDPWVYLLVFLAAASEAALFIGLVFPGETVLFVAGLLAWRGDLPLVPAMAAAIVGAVVGDSIGYEMGRHFGNRLRYSRLGQKLGDHRWERAHVYLLKKGGRAVFFARFVSVLKTVVPALAGQARMPYRRFLVWNATGAFLWGILHVGIGFLAGESYHQVHEYVGQAGLALVGGLVAVVFVVGLYRRRRDWRVAERAPSPAEAYLVAEAEIVDRNPEPTD